MTMQDVERAVDDAREAVIMAAIDYAARPAGSGPAFEIHEALARFEEALLGPPRIIIEAAVRTWRVLELQNRLSDGGHNAHLAGVKWLEAFGDDEEPF